MQLPNRLPNVRLQAPRLKRQLKVDTRHDAPMPPRRLNPSVRELTVVLDTNALYTGSASYFIKKELADLVSKHSQHLDLKVKWVVPEVVRHERQFQMLEEAQRLLPPIEKLERLLGHNLNITASILEERVRAAVDRQVQEHALTVRALDTTRVDWTWLMHAAAYRKPPFQSGEKEKGFRDALILETFSQIVSEAPARRAAPRIALVSGDQLLRAAAAERTAAVSNVHVLESLEELKGLLNTLASSVDEQFIESIKAAASVLFHRPKDLGSLYYRESVGSRALESLSDSGFKLPSGAERYVVDKYVIGTSAFLKKEGQRIHWSTRLDLRLRAMRSFPRDTWASTSNVYMAPQTSASSITVPWVGNPSSNSLTLGAMMSPPLTLTTRPVAEATWQVGNVTLGDAASEQQVGRGVASVDVMWSVAIATSGKLVKPQLEGVTFVEVVWE